MFYIHHYLEARMVVPRHTDERRGAGNGGFMEWNGATVQVCLGGFDVSILSLCWFSGCSFQRYIYSPRTSPIGTLLPSGSVITQFETSMGEMSIVNAAENSRSKLLYVLLSPPSPVHCVQADDGIRGHSFGLSYGRCSNQARWSHNAWAGLHGGRGSCLSWSWGMSLHMMLALWLNFSGLKANNCAS